MRYRLLMALVVVLAALCARAAAGETEAQPTYWVDRDSVGGACDDARTTDEARSAATPWCTLERANALVPDGGEIRVRAGTYPELRLNDGPVRSATVTFRAEPGEKVEIDGVRLRAISHLRFEGFRLVGPTSVGAGATSIALVGNEVALTEPRAAISLGVDPIDGRPTQDVVVEDNDIHDVRSMAGHGTAGYGIRAGSRIHDVRIRGNRFSRIQVDAIQLSGSDILIEDNVISHVDKREDSESHSDPIQILRGERITLRRNLLHDNAHAVLIHAGVLGVVVEGNVIARTRNYALKLGDSPGARIVNNTTWDNELGGMTISDDETNPLMVDGVVLANNILDGLDVDDEVGFRFAGHNLYRTSPQGPAAVRGPGDVYGADPLFMDREMLDLRPSAVSPAVDRAAGDYAPPADRQGVPPYDDPAVPQSGSGAVPYGDVGALERDPTLSDPSPPPALRVAGDARFVLPPGGRGRRVLRVFNGTDEAQQYTVTSSAGWLEPATGELLLGPRETGELTVDATAGTESPATADATLTVAGESRTASTSASLLVRRAEITEPRGAVRVEADRLPESPLTVMGAADPGQEVRLQAIPRAGAGEGARELGSAAADSDGRWSHAVAGGISARGDHLALRAVPAAASASDAADYSLGSGRLLHSRFAARHPDHFGGAAFSDVATDRAVFRGILGVGDDVDELWLYAGSESTEATILPSWGLEVEDAAGSEVRLVESSHTGGWTGETAEVRTVATLAGGEAEPTTVERTWTVGAEASHARVQDKLHNGGTVPRTYRLTYPVVSAAPARDTEYRPSTFPGYVGDADYDARGGREVGWTFSGGPDAPREGHVLSRHERATGGDPAFGHNFVVWHRRPARVASADQDRARLELEYEVTVAPGETEEIVHELGSTRSDTESAQLASELDDTRGPELQVDAPADGPLTSGRSVAVSGSASDESAPVHVTVDGKPATVGAGGFFEARVPLPDDDGPVEIAIAAEDTHGHRTEVVRRLDVERGEAPETRIVSGPDEMTNATTARVELAASVSGEPVDGAVFECSLDGADWTQCGPVVGLAGLEEESYELRARAVTSRGRVDLTPARHAWTVDWTPPAAFEGLMPAADAHIATARPQLSWDAAAGAARYEVWVDDSRAADTTATAWTPPSDLADGPHRWQVRAFDAAGNHRAGIERTFTVDTAPPAAFTLTAPGHEAVLASRRPALSWDAPADAARCEAWIDGVFAGTGASRSNPAADLAEGSHAWHVRCFDAAGNQRLSGARTFTVDVTPPAAFDLEAPAHDAILASRKPALTWKAAAGAARYELWLDNARAADTTATTWTPPAELAEGAHRWQVRAYDTAGNRRTSSERAFTVHVTPPAAFDRQAPAHDPILAKPPLQEAAPPASPIRLAKLRRLGPGRYRVRVKLTTTAWGTLRIVARRRGRGYHSRPLKVKTRSTVTLRFKLPPGKWKAKVQLVPPTGARTPASRSLGRLDGARAA